MNQVPVVVSIAMFGFAASLYGVRQSCASVARSKMDDSLFAETSLS